MALFAVGGAGAVVALGAMSAGAAPTNFLVLDGNIRNGAPAISYDWGNSGTTYGTCAGGGIDAIGSKGIFNCGKQVAPSGTNTNPVPIAPTLTATAAADPTIVASAFVVDPLFNSTSKNTGLTCPVTGASTTGGDPTALITGASKNDLPLSGFVYAPTSLQPKDDLADVYAIAHRTPGVNEVFFGAERVINNGASHIDFEFLQSPVSLVPSGTTGSAACTGNLSGHRTGGDFLAAMDFSTGGSFGSATIYEWSCGGLASNIMQGTQCDPGSVGFPNAKYIVAPDASAFTIAFNGPATKGGTNNIPCGGWVCRGEMPTDNINTVSTNEFMEGGVDLKQLGFTGCVNTFLPHTRSSPDINSTLQDFAGPVNFNTCSIKTAPGAAVTDVRSASGISDTATVDGFIGTPGSVEFKLYGPFASASAIGLNSCTGTTVGTGNLIFDKVVGPGSQTGAPATYTATTPASPTSGYYQWVDSYSSPSGAVEAKSFCGDTSEQALLVDANIQIAPLTKANEVGTNHVLTAHVNVSNPPNAATSFVNAPAGTTINFTVTNSNGANATPATGSCTTIGTTGSCTFTITSSKPGQTTIQATTTVSVGGLALTRTTGDGFTDSANASKTWVDAYIALSPLTKTNEIKADHTLTASVFVNDGSGAGYVAAPNGTTVNFLVTNSNGATATPTSGSCNTSGGSCTFTINSPTAGTVGINASVSITVGGVTLNRSTGDGLSQDSANASKTYVDANINLSPPTRVNEVGKVHTITATVLINDGSGAAYGPAPDNTLVTLSLSNANGATASFVAGSTCLTSGGTGQCSVQINSPTPGLVTINATTTLSVGGVSLTRSTGDSNAGDGPAVTKTYVDAFITLALQHTPDQVGDVENVTATVKINDGSGAGYVAEPSALVNLSILSGSVGNFVPSGMTTSCTTDATGQCMVQITSLVKGTTTVHASTTVVVGGVTLNRATGDGISQDGQDVVKTWLPYTPNLGTTPSAGGTVGSVSLSDTANVTGAFGAAGSSDKVTFSLFGPFATQAAAQADCSGTPVFTDANKTLTGGVAGQKGQSWSASSGSFSPTLAGWYAWQVTADFTGDQANNNPTPNPSPCSAETVQVKPANPSLATTASSPAGIVINTTVSISDAAQLSNFVSLQAGDTVTFSLYGPFGSGTPVCDTTNNTNRVLGPFTGAVNTTTGAANSGPQTFTPTAAGTYYWVASFSGDVNNTTLNATNIGCGDSHEAVVVTAPTAQITPTGTTCQQFAGGTAGTLSTVNYSGTGTISTVNPGVFFYYEKVTITTGQTITANEIITSGENSTYLLPVLNGSTSQVQLYDASCNTINAGTITIGPTGTSPYTVTISGLPAGTYIFSVKYTPKSLVGLAVPSPTTITYSFYTTVNGATVSGSTQGISAVKS